MPRRVFGNADLANIVRLFLDVIYVSEVLVPEPQVLNGRGAVVQVVTFDRGSAPGFSFPWPHGSAKEHGRGEREQEEE